ncbi:unnamed protein product [Mesocestoides corti]|uniref:Disease resistance R13L4/SHOC-2-like LRR domain-containing protein n=1 Tax=Mesocestoides corti TaxID=53468 RepID=A0A0R3UNV6_MESCO|nr:unnamed protein product [Mesocestoides corti]
MASTSKFTARYSHTAAAAAALHLSEEEQLGEFDCLADLAGGVSSDHNSPKSSSTRECSPFASAVEIAEECMYTREEHFMSDNGDISVHSSSKPIRLPCRASGFRLSDGHKKSVQMQFEGRKFKSAAKSNAKKEKPPDVTAELTRCKAEESSYLEFSDSGLQFLPTGIFKELPHVETLFLNGNKLTGLPSGQLTSLPNLRRLLLQQNAIVCAGLPADLANLKSLEVLDLRHNRLEGQLPACVYALSGLKQLILSYNKLHTLSDDIKNLQRLTILIVNRNSIRHDIPSTIGQLAFLTKLDLSYNHIQSLPPSLGQCTQLTDLYLHYNQLTHLPESIGHLTNLTRLMLKYNRLVEVPESLAKCTRLDEFNVENNQLAKLPRIRDARREALGGQHVLITMCGSFTPGPVKIRVPVDARSFLVSPLADPSDDLEADQSGRNTFCLGSVVGLLASMTSVRNVTFSRNFFSVFPPGGQEQYSHVATLNMDHNRITEVPPGVLQHLRQVSRLNLRDNEIVELHAEDLLHWNNLVELDLGSNHLSSLPDEVEALRALEVFRLNYNQLRHLPSSIGNLVRLRVLDLESNHLESLPPSIGQFINLQDLNVSCNCLTTFPPSIGLLSELKIFRAGENDIRELPPEIGQMTNLRDLYLNDNHNLNNIPAEMSQCPVLTILSVENCPLRDLPQPIVSGGSAMIIYCHPPRNSRSVDAGNPRVSSPPRPSADLFRVVHAAHLSRSTALNVFVCRLL